ncbi:MAG: hypothetical protein Q4C26_02925 [Bacteroidales bacterium]|nr:hypothetical protein [Bacteroidales bacterium]
MKRLLSLVALFATLALVSCKKDDEKVSLEFTKSVAVMLADSPVDVTLKASAAVEEEVIVPALISGDAVADDEYTVSSNSFKFAAGSSTATITFTPKNNLTQGKSIVVQMGTLPSGYTMGTQTQCVVTVDAKELISYSFSVEKADLLDKYKMTIELSGMNSGKNFTVTEDTKIPFKFADASTAKEGTDFEVEGGAKEFVVKAGTRTASVMLASKDGAKLGEEKSVTVEVDKAALSSRFLAGNTPTLTVAIKGILRLSSLVGEWSYVGVVEEEEWAMWFEEMEDDVELLPFKNKDYTISFAENEDGTFTFKPGSTTGDLSALFREGKVGYKKIEKNADGKYNVNIINKNKYEVLSDYCTIESNMFYGEETSLTYFSLEKINRTFSKTTEKIGEGVIAMRVNEDGNLEIHLRDYEKPPFGANWWDDKDVDWEMFGFIYIFKKK